MENGQLCITKWIKRYAVSAEDRRSAKRRAPDIFLK